MRRLLTIGHSYVVAQNRMLAHQMALQGSGAWEVTAVAPATLVGDLRAIRFETIPNEACAVVTTPMRLESVPHLRSFSGIRALLAERWDVVHAWEEPYVAAAAQIARHVHPSSWMVPATFQNISKRYPWPLSAFERRVMARASGWIAFGSTVREALAARAGYTERPCRVIGPGVDPSTFRVDRNLREATRERLGWSDDVPVVGYVGRFVEQKGIRVLLRALSKVAVPWRALFVGGGPLLAELQQFAAGYPAGRVRIVTGAAHGEVPAYLNAMDVLCAPSQTTAAWQEQFGRMLIEAMSCGVPVAASRSGEIPHVVDAAGVLVDEADESAWAGEIAALLRQPERRGDLSANGLRRVHARFTWAHVARAHLTFFDDLLAGRCH